MYKHLPNNTLVQQRDCCGIVYSTSKNEKEKGSLNLEGYCDSDWGNDPDTRKSITGYVVKSGFMGISTTDIVAQSTAEAEFVAACEACMEGQSLRNIVTEVFPELQVNFTLEIDNQAAFMMTTNPTYSRRTRHIELRWHYVRDQVTKKTVYLWKVSPDDNPSDIFTKPLAGARYEKLCALLGQTKEPLPKN
ncbi:Hypothetical protein PHPALM_20512 [Phytophthora palmivora]|uniref:Uncharacterized protein n=1 Tax=Phytophthora palmivora TaxID=4796 RepID=A0A2P4XEP7_9STRA|nr:Hypothetical protein PHPALM_20512 [Phytophthora palmivora]